MLRGSGTRYSRHVPHVCAQHALICACCVQELQRRGELTELRGQLAAVQQTLSAKLDALETAQGRLDLPEN